MKKGFILALFLMIAFAGRAQFFELGLKAGVNVSNFTGGDFGDVEKNSLIGFHGGGFISLFLGGKNLALQPELLFSTQGARFEDQGDEEDFKVTYLNIPVMLKYRFNSGFYLEAGPQIGFKLDESIPDSPIEDFAKSTDLSICGGLGFHSKMGLGIGARYNLGLSKVGDFDPNLADPDFKNGVLQFSLFYTLFRNSGKKKE